ncbi:MAG: DNA polymerase III subunit beta, partial [Pseudomonadales bacterium]|nr:DNA polymerase III subunit beta [Pseudomonadales bacterium]
GTDQEVERSAGTTLQDGEPGEVTVPARKLMEICRSLPEKAVIEGELEENRVAIRSGQFRSHLATLPVVEFPNVEMEQGQVEFSIVAAKLDDLIDKTSFAMAQQDVRYFFNGMLLEVDQATIRVVATNGQRLATSFLDDGPDGEEKLQFIIPRKGILELGRLIGDAGEETVTLQFSPNHMKATCGRATLITKLIDGAYPDYGRAIPSAGDKVLMGDRREIREALSRTAILSNEMYRNVRLMIEPDKLEMHANNPLQEEAEETISVDYNGGDLEIGFNVGYLIEALSAMAGDKVRMVFSDSKSAALISDPEDDKSLYVISPMML